MPASVLIPRTSETSGKWLSTIKFPHDDAAELADALHYLHQVSKVHRLSIAGAIYKMAKLVDTAKKREAEEGADNATGSQ